MALPPAVLRRDVPRAPSPAFSPAPQGSRPPPGPGARSGTVADPARLSVLSPAPCGRGRRPTSGAPAPRPSQAQQPPARAPPTSDPDAGPRAFAARLPRGRAGVRRYLCCAPAPCAKPQWSPAAILASPQSASRPRARRGGASGRDVTGPRAARAPPRAPGPAPRARLAPSRFLLRLGPRPRREPRPQPEPRLPRDRDVSGGLCLALFFQLRIPSFALRWFSFLSDLVGVGCPGACWVPAFSCVF